MRGSTTAFPLCSAFPLLFTDHNRRSRRTALAAVALSCVGPSVWSFRAGTAARSAAPGRGSRLHLPHLGPTAWTVYASCMRSGRRAGMRRTALAVVWAVAGCATGRVDLNRQIDVDRRWYGHSYEQDGRRIGRCNLALELYETPEGRRPAWSAGNYAMNGLLFLGASVGAGIAASGTSGRTSAALLGASAVSLLVSVFAFHRADQRVADAASAHNASVAHRSYRDAPGGTGVPPSEPETERKQQPAVRCSEPARLE